MVVDRRSIPTMPDIEPRAGTGSRPYAVLVLSNVLNIEA